MKETGHSPVALLFPPLVNTGFGNYYPSLAVLAGFLKREGIHSIQLDLNEALAEHLLQDHILDELKEGKFIPGTAHLPPKSNAALAARVLSLHKHQLYDAEGKHAFNQFSAGPAYLLKDLTDPYHINYTIGKILLHHQDSWPLQEWYMNFYRTEQVETAVENADIIGISVAMGPQLAPAIFLAEYLKTCFPDRKIILGGPGISLLEKEDLSAFLYYCRFIDAAVKYDGEKPLLKLVHAFRENNWKPWEIPGVSCIHEGKYTEVPPEKGLHLNDMAWAHYDKKLVNRLSNPEIGISLTRGCYWGECAYCDFVELYEGSPAFRTRRAADFVDELEFQVQEHGLRNFTFITEAIPPGFARRFSTLIMERQLKITWGSFAMVDARFSQELFDLMAASGCDSLVLGVETTIDRVLALVKKQAHREEILDFIQKGHASGIKLYVNLIPDLPTTNYQEAMDALEDFKAVADCIYGIAIFPFEATRSSEIGRNPEAYGLSTAALRDHEMDTGQAEFASNHLRILDDAMTAEERQQVIKAYKTFSVDVGNQPYYQPSYTPEQPGIFKYNGEYLDILEYEDGCQVFNWKMRKAWETTKGMRVLMQRLEQHNDAVFTHAEFTGLYGAEVGNYLLAELLDHGVIIQLTSPYGN